MLNVAELTWPVLNPEETSVSLAIFYLKFFFRLKIENSGITLVETSKKKLTAIEFIMKSSARLRDPTFPSNYKTSNCL